MIYKSEKSPSLKLIEIVNDLGIFLKESPAITTISVGDKYDIPDYNKEECNRILNKSKQIGEFSFGNKKHNIHLEVEKDIYYYSLIYNNEYVILVYDVKPITINNLKGCESINVIQSRLGDRSGWLHIANEFVFNFLLKNYEFIMSDKIHTSTGRNFWKGLLISGLKKSYCYVFNTDNEKMLRLTDINNFDVFYRKDYYNFRFLISGNKSLGETVDK